MGRKARVEDVIKESPQEGRNQSRRLICKKSVGYGKTAPERDPRKL